MILLVTPAERAPDWAEALRDEVGEKVIVAETLLRATALLRVEEFLLVLLDQPAWEAEPDEAEVLIEQLGSALLLTVNLAISGFERLRSEARAALRRRRREEASARQAALTALNEKLSGTLTALLLSSELARQVPGLPAEAAAKLDAVCLLAARLRQELAAETGAENDADTLRTPI